MGTERIQEYPKAKSTWVMFFANLLAESSEKFPTQGFLVIGAGEVAESAWKHLNREVPKR